MNIRIGGVICWLALLGLSGCAATPGRSPGDKPPTQGVVIGNVTLNGEVAPLTHVYAREPESSAGATPASGADKTRLVLTNEALSATQLAELRSGVWSDGGRIRGVLVDIGADSKWDVQFIEPSGLTGSYGITSSGGKVGSADGRWCGRIAVSNQNESGMRSLRASFNTPAGNEAPRASGAARAPTGRWRIARWIGDKGQIHSGDIAFANASSGVVARARIETAGTDCVAEELFDVRVSEDAVRLFGVVDPDARWVADTIVLTRDASGNTLSGTAKDIGGETVHELLLVRAR